MESMTSQSIEEGNEDVTVVDGGGGASMRVDGSIETTWKHYMMFSGTSLLMHSERRVDIEGSSSSSSSSSSSDSILSAQDKGCLVEVVRTGFGTSSQMRRGDDYDDDGDDDDENDDDNNSYDYNNDATCRVDSCVSSYLRPNERVTGNSSSETYILLHRRSISRVCSRSSQLLSCCMEA